MSRSDFSRLSLRLGTGETFGLAHLIERLAGLGYERVEEVEAMGQFSARGGIVDVFPVNRTTPVRVEFFDEEIDSLRKVGAETHAERIAELSAQADTLRDMLPAQLVGQDLERLADKLIAELGATSKRDMGKVMGALGKATDGNFDKPAAAAYVGKRLS